MYGCAPEKLLLLCPCWSQCQQQAHHYLPQLAWWTRGWWVLLPLLHETLLTRVACTLCWLLCAVEWRYCCCCHAVLMQQLLLLSWS